MKVLFVLNDQKSITNFIYILKVLHGNSAEVCLSFSRAGMSLSQSWDKSFSDMSETAKYFFFIESLQFSKTTCQNSSNLRVRLNIKDVFTKLKGLKKELREVTISVTNESKNIEINQDYCLFEIHAEMFTHGSVIYRTGCRLEQTPKEFIPLVYYDHIQTSKPLLLASEPKKLDFLKDFRNDFVELFLKEKKVELYGNLKFRKVIINPTTCFLTYNYHKLIEIVKEDESLILPPNHLLRYREVCEKWNKNVVIHIENSVPFQGFLKLFCSTRVDKNVFILKLKTKLHEKVAIVQSLPNVRPISSQTDVRSTMHVNTMRNYSTATCQKDTRGSTFPFSIEENMIQGFNSMPNERLFNHMGERPTDSIQSHNKNGRKKKSPFMLSQEDEGFKRTKLSVNQSQEEQITSINLCKRLENPVPKIRSILFSPDKIQEIVMSKASQETRESRRIIEIEENRNESQSQSNRDSSGKRVKVQKSHKSSDKIEKKKDIQVVNVGDENEQPLSPLFSKALFPVNAKTSIRINFTEEKGKVDEERVPLKEPLNAEQINDFNKSFVGNLTKAARSLKL